MRDGHRDPPRRVRRFCGNSGTAQRLTCLRLAGGLCTWLGQWISSAVSMSFPACGWLLSGDARLLLVVGDAGVGKTRFAREGLCPPPLRMSMKTSLTVRMQDRAFRAHAARLVVMMAA